MRAMSDKDNYRKARPVFIGDVTKRDGQVKNVLNDNDKKFANVAKKSLEPFIANRYNMFRDNVGEGNMRILDLLEYHVYGEYRLSGLVGDPKVDPTQLRLGFARPSFLAPRGVDPRTYVERASVYDQFTNFTNAGLMVSTGSMTVQSDYFDSVLNSSDPGMMFFLPSLGTAIMSLVPFTTAWPTSLRKYFVGNTNNQKGGRIPELFNKIIFNANDDDNRKLSPDGEARSLYRAPWFEDANTDEAVRPIFDAVATRAYGGSVPDVFRAQEINMFFISWAHAIITSSDFRNMSDKDRADIRRAVCQDAMRATFTTRKNGLTQAQADSFLFSGGGPPNTDAFLDNLNYTDGTSMNIYGACDEFMRFLEGIGAADPYIGKIVTFNPGGTTYQERLFNERKVPYRNDDLSGKAVSYTHLTLPTT